MTTIAQHVMDFLAAQSLHLLILFAAVLAATVLLRHKTAHLRYLLWLLIVAKCLIPPLHTIPLAVLPEAAVIEDGRLTMDEGEGSDDFRWTRDEVGDIQRSGLSLPENEHAQAWAANAVGTAQPAEEHANAPTTNEDVRRSGFSRSLGEEHAKAPTTNAVTLIAVVWLGGAAVYFLVIVVKGVRFERYVRRQRVELTAQSHPAWAGFLAATLPNARPFRLYQLSRPGQPFVWGLWRGAIYLPSNFADVNDPEKQHSILMHEAGHILRLDPVVNLLQVVAQGLFWFHPLVWAANRIIRAEREKCCDEFAVATLKAPPRSYCTAIVDALMAAGPARPAIPTLAVAGPVKNIEDRIKTLLTPGKRFYTRPTIAAMLTILLVAVIVVPTTVALSHRVKLPEVGSRETDYSVVLPNGVMVQLIGIREHPGEDSQWWRPDGILLQTPIDTQKARYDKSVVFDENTEDKLELVLRCLWPDLTRHQDYTGTDQKGLNLKDSVTVGKTTCRVLSMDVLDSPDEGSIYYSIVTAVPKTLRGQTAEVSIGTRYGLTNDEFIHAEIQRAIYKNVTLRPILDQKSEIRRQEAEGKPPEKKTTNIKKIGFFDRKTLMKFQSADPPTGVYSTIGDTTTYSKTYDVVFRKGEKLLVYAELYQVGKPMRPLGSQIFNGSDEIQNLSVTLKSTYLNDGKTSVGHDINVSMNGQSLRIDNIQVDTPTFFNNWSWGFFDMFSANQKESKISIDDLQEIKSLAVLRVFKNSTPDTRRSPRIWMPAYNHVTWVDNDAYFIQVKMFPLSQLDKLLIDAPDTAYQTQLPDGSFLPGDASKEERTAVSHSYLEYVKRMTLPDVRLTFLAKSPIRSLQEYWHTIKTSPRPSPPLYKPAPIPPYDFEICRASDQKRIALLPMSAAFEDGWGQMTPSAQRQIGQLPDGEYLLRFVAGNESRSNSARLIIDSNFNPETEPTLSLVALPLEPGEQLPLLGIRAVGPVPQDPELRNDSIAFPTLIVDGVERNLSQIIWTGPVGPLESGQIYLRLLSLEDYLPKIEPGRTHTVKAIVGKYETPEIVIPTYNEISSNVSETLRPGVKTEVTVQIRGDNTTESKTELALETLSDWQRAEVEIDNSYGLMQFEVSSLDRLLGENKSTDVSNFLALFSRLADEDHLYLAKIGFNTFSSDVKMMVTNIQDQVTEGHFDDAQAELKKLASFYDQAVSAFAQVKHKKTSILKQIVGEWLYPQGNTILQIHPDGQVHGFHEDTKVYGLARMQDEHIIINDEDFDYQCAVAGDIMQMHQIGDEKLNSTWKRIWDLREIYLLDANSGHQTLDIESGRILEFSGSDIDDVIRQLEQAGAGGVLYVNKYDDGDTFDLFLYKASILKGSYDKQDRYTVTFSKKKPLNYVEFISWKGYHTQIQIVEANRNSCRLLVFYLEQEPRPQVQPLNIATVNNTPLRPDGKTAVEIGVERPEDTQRFPGASNFDFADIWRFVGSDLPKYTFALYRVIGHEYAPSFGSSPSDGRRRILFSETEKEDIFDASRPENYPLPGLILDKQPLFTEQDIVWYDWQSQQILLKPEALRRLPQIHKPPVNVFGVPFMVAVNGQRIYLGAFWTSVSSRSSGVPTIELGVFREARMQENVIEIWGGGIRKEMEQTTYPQRDWRIRDALASAGLLKEQYAEHASALRPDGETEVEVQSSVPGPSASGEKKTLEANLKTIFTACQMYQIDNGKWPESIEDLQSSDGYGPYIIPRDTDDFSRLRFTRPYVNYRQITDPARTHFIYDISMLEEHKEIAVVYLDGHIEFLSPENEEFIGYLGNTFFPSEPPELNMNPVQSPNFELQRIN